MKLYAPKYYQKFKCIAEKCPHSCCIGWEIDIDENTLEKYEMLSGYGETIRKSISYDGAPHFKLCSGDRCPHLDECGLCRIITSVGEDYLCDICREHPRFYNFTDVCEVGVGMSCPEAARIILGSADYAELLEIGEIDSTAEECDFDARAERGAIYERLCDVSCGYEERLDKIYGRYLIDTGEDGIWLEMLDSLEYLDEDHKVLFMNYSSSLRPDGFDEVLERFLAYFIYRHCTEAFDAEDFCARLAFCLFCERLFASLICAEGANTKAEIEKLASIISEEIEYSEDNTAILMGNELL